MKGTKPLISLVLIALVFFACSSDFERSEPKISKIPENFLSSQGINFFKKIGNSYDWIDYLDEINGKVVARAYDEVETSNGVREMYVVYGDEEFGPYSFTGDVVEFGDGIAFYARENSSDNVMFINGVERHTGKDVKNYIVTDKTQINVPCELSGSPYEVGSKLAFSCEKYATQTSIGNGIFEITPYIKSYLDYKEIGQKYDSVFNLQELNGKLYYEAHMEDGSSYIISEDEPVKTLVDNPRRLSVVNGDISYWGEKGGKDSVVINGDLIIPADSFDLSPKFIQGKVFYVDKSDDGSLLIHYGDGVFGPYDRVDDLTLNAKLENEHVILKILDSSGKRLFIDGQFFGPYSDIDDFSFRETSDDLYFSALPEISSPFHLYRASDGSVLAKNSGSPAELIGGKIFYIEYVYDEGPFPSGIDYFVDGDNLSKKYDGKYEPFSAVDFNGDFSLFAYTADEQLFVIYNDVEYGPFPEFESYFEKHGKVFVIIEENGKRSLYTYGDI